MAAPRVAMGSGETGSRMRIGAGTRMGMNVDVASETYGGGINSESDASPFLERNEEEGPPRPQSQPQQEESIPTVSFQQQIIDSVKANKAQFKKNINSGEGGPCMYVVRPAFVAQKLGMSVEDANAELCGLLKAVGHGATFTFETLYAKNENENKKHNITISNENENENENGIKEIIRSSKPISVMVFSFPMDFERLAKRSQQRDDLKMAIAHACRFALKFLKIFTAFGLLLSLMIVSVAAIVAMVAALVALSQTQGNDRHSQARFRQFCNLIRQMMWCYALFGSDNQGDPFLRDAAYDTSLLLSLCWGNPASLWFWVRARQLRRRRQHTERGWGRQASSFVWNNDNNAYSVPDRTDTDEHGVALVRRTSWGQTEMNHARHINAYDAVERQGILSIAVEFLFGPDGGQAPKPTESVRWKLRGAVIMEKSSSGISLGELLPYADQPPPPQTAVMNQYDHQTVAEGLATIAHFNGVPSDRTSSTSIRDSRFAFPELLAEGANMVIDYADFSGCIPPDGDETRWQDLFYQDPHAVTGFPRMTELPEYLHEQRLVFSRLSGSAPILYCVGLGVMNLWGVFWLSGAVRPGGVLQAAAALDTTLLPILRFYSILFFALPSIRLAWIVGVRNSLIDRRNSRRSQHAKALKSKASE